MVVQILNLGPTISLHITSIPYSISNQHIIVMKEYSAIPVAARF